MSVTRRGERQEEKMEHQHKVVRGEIREKENSEKVRSHEDKPDYVPHNMYLDCITISFMEL